MRWKKNDVSSIGGLGPIWESWNFLLLASARLWSTTLWHRQMWESTHMHTRTHTPKRKYINVYNRIYIYIQHTHIYIIHHIIYIYICKHIWPQTWYFKILQDVWPAAIIKHGKNSCDSMDLCGGYPPVIKHGYENSPQKMEVFERTIIYKWWMFHRHSRIPVLSCPPIKCWMLSGRNTEMSWGWWKLIWKMVFYPAFLKIAWFISLSLGGTLYSIKVKWYLYVHLGIC